MPDAAPPVDGALQSLDGAGRWHDAWLWLSATGDLLITAACISLSALLLYALQQRPELPRPSLRTLAVCLLLLGLTHAAAVWNLWGTPPWLLVGMKNAAAAVAILTAVCLWRQLPRLLALPTQEQLRRCEAALQRSHEELESFMSSVSHDLRSPLTTIAGQAGLLELSLGANATDDLKRRVQRIHHSVRHMSQLIEALLALSRIARQDLHPESLDLSTLAKQVLEELERKDPQRTVSISIQPGLHAYADRRLVTDLLGHVLGNAWKFTSRSPAAHIEVGAMQEAGAVSLYVRDNGVGFDMAYAPKLFKPFQRLHSPSDFEGAGVGLASAARIIARHGGKIWVQATPQHGATFYFTLPKQ